LITRPSNSSQIWLSILDWNDLFAARDARLTMSRFRPVQRIDGDDTDRARHAGTNLAVVVLLLIAEAHVAMVDLALDGNDIFGANAAFAALAVRDNLEPAAFGAPSIELPCGNSANRAGDPIVAEKRPDDYAINDPELQARIEIAHRPLIEVNDAARR
jgi:hypothetical protein